MGKSNKYKIHVEQVEQMIIIYATHFALYVQTNLPAVNALLKAELKSRSLLAILTDRCSNTSPSTKDKICPTGLKQLNLVIRVGTTGYIGVSQYAWVHVFAPLINPKIVINNP